MSQQSVRIAAVGAAIAVTILGVATSSVDGKPNRPHTSDLAAVSPPSASPSAVASPSATASPSPSPSIDPALAVRTQVAAYLAPYGSHTSFALLDQVTGEEILYHENTEFETGSIVKVDILATLLWQNQQSATNLSPSQQQLATDMITESDNGAASALWDQVGGASGLAEANVAFGLTETTPGQDGFWGLTTTTSADQLRLLRMISDSAGPLDSSSRTYLLGLMSHVEDDQRWGVPDAASAQATAVYVKNGWLSRSTEDDRWIINSIGRIVEPGHDWLVVVLSHDNATQSSGIALVQHAADLAVRNPSLRP
jgi:beta-lactamase class A